MPKIDDQELIQDPQQPLSVFAPQFRLPTWKVGHDFMRHAPREGVHLTSVLGW
jgi:hypothetical protein